MLKIEKKIPLEFLIYKFIMLKNYFIKKINCKWKEKWKLSIGANNANKKNYTIMILTF